MSSQQGRILYFVPECRASTSGVLASTVLAEAGFLANHGYTCMFVGSDVSAFEAASAQADIEKRYGISARVYGCHSLRYGVVSAWSTARKCARLSAADVAEFNPDYVWTRAFTIAPVGRMIAEQCGAASVLSVRAAASEEVAGRRGRGFRYRISLERELGEIRAADRVSAISHKLAEWVREKTGRDDMVVVPCCLDSKRFAFDAEARELIRREYGFGDDERVLCYCGGLSDWQRVGDIVSLFADVANRSDRIKFMFLTQKTDRMRDLVEATGLPDQLCTIRSCLPGEVAHYLSAADVGVIMRDDTTVNNVASPIKIGEYLGCGLPVVLTKGIGDYSKMVSEAGVGLLIDESGDIAGQVLQFVRDADFESMRKDSIAFAREHISWESHLDDLKRLYSQPVAGSI